VDARRQIQPQNMKRIIEQFDADVIALQEVDGPTALNPGPNQAMFFGEELNQNYVYFQTDEYGLRAFGLAVISRYDIVDVHFDWLPRLHPRLNLRKRGAVRVTLDTNGGKIHVINTHLSVYKLEGYKQIKALLAGSWFSGIAPDEPVILCGDFNAGPSSIIYKTATRRFTDVQKAMNNDHKPKATFHSRSSFWRIDHLFVSDHFTPLEVEVRRSDGIRMASDHLPLAAELALHQSAASLTSASGRGSRPISGW
jgi:endonuclease/exonuclease/phosphatase family metal-dependent hydrolase